MHIPPSAMLPATLLSLLLSSSSTASAISDRSTCVRENAPILNQAAACGNQDPSLQECFLSVPDIVTVDDLQTCFVESGCTIAEAASEAAVILQSCDASASVSAPELRRRDAVSETSPTPTPTPTPTPAATKDDDDKDNSGSITTSGIVVAVVLSLAVVAVVAVVLYHYLKERKKRVLARAEEEEAKRKTDQAAAEAARRTFAQEEVARERERRQRIEALEWAQRNGSHPRFLPGDQNPFDDRGAIA